jgi:membrane associated rhomboid family serine protease
MPAGKVHDVPGRYQFSLPERPARDGWFRLGSIDVTTTALLVGLGIVSMFVYAIDKTFLFELAFVGEFVRDGEVWRLVTWPLVNPPDSIWVIITLAFFWFVGHRIEDEIGRGRYTWLILAMTVIPAAFCTALDFDPVAYTNGLGVLGIGLLVVFALDSPGALFFFGIPAWVLAAIYVAIDVLRYLGDRMYEPLVLELTSIVVALVGARQCGMLDSLEFIPRLGGRQKRPASAPRPARRRGESSVVAGPWAASPSPADQFELDALLDKISARGMDSLTRDEKQRLNELSKRLRGN